MDILLIRHCAATGQEADAPLTEKGTADATRLADWLITEEIEAIYASPFSRAVATLEPLAARTGLPIRTDPRLQERILSAAPRADWLHHLEVSFRDFSYRLDGGESIGEAQARGLAALEDVASTGHARVAVASHGNLIAAILAAIDPAFGFEAWRAMTNPDVFRLTLEGGRPTRFRRIKRV